MSERPVERPASPPLGPVTLIALGLNGIVGVGIFVSPPEVARAFGGISGAFAYALVALACVPVAITFTTLARVFPHDGGPSLYARHALGDRVARGVGVVAWLSALLSTSAVTRALGDLIAHAGGGGARAAAVASVAIVVVLTAVNLRGLAISAIAWTVLTVLKLLPLLALAAIGLAVKTDAPLAPTTNHAAWGSALLAILFALQGFEIVPLPAGQVRDPHRNVPLATVGSLIAAGLLYALVYLACARGVADLGHADAPIPQAAAALGGPRLGLAVSFGVTASIAGIVVGMHAMTSRYLDAAIGAPSSSSRSLLVTAAIVSVLVVVGDLSKLVDLSAIAVLAQYGVTAVALAVLALRRRHGLRPRDGWPAPLAAVVVVVLIRQAPLRELTEAVGIGLFAALVARDVARADASE